LYDDNIPNAPDETEHSMHYIYPRQLRWARQQAHTNFGAQATLPSYTLRDSQHYDEQQPSMQWVEKHDLLRVAPQSARIAMDAYWARIQHIERL
jgi:hypothetical protein